MKERGEGRGHASRKTFARVCTRDYSGTGLIAPIQGLIRDPGERCRRYPRIVREYNPVTAIKIRPLTKPRTCERGSYIFVAMSWLNFDITTSASLPSMPYTEGQIEKNVSVSCGSSYHAYISFPSPTETGDYTLVRSCRFPRTSIQIWCWLWNQSGFPIIPEWERHIVFPIRAPPEVPPTLICCGHGGWRFCRIHSECRRIFNWGRAAHRTLHFGVLWQFLSYCS